MNYRNLGNSGIKLSEIGLGGWLTFGHVANERTGRELIAAASDCGINFFDTANVYATGACETMWGELLGGIRPLILRAGDQGLFPDGRWSERPRPFAQAHHGAVRGQPETVGHRLHRPVPVPPLR